MGLLGDEALARSAVVANCQMNRERRLRSYNRELGIDILALLRARGRAPVRWLDLCCGAALALFEAADALGDGVEITGVDLVDGFAGPSQGRRLRLVEASVSAWDPGTRFDLITCVHGLHYVGDKLGTLARVTSWLTDDGRFAANFDVRSVRLADGAPAGRRLTAVLRASGFVYDTRNRRISCQGRGEVVLPYRYLGSDDQAGPNYTGQAAVDSYYHAQ